MAEVRKEPAPKFSRMFKLIKGDSITSKSHWTGYSVMYAHVQLGSIPREKFNEVNAQNKRHLGRNVTIKYLLHGDLIAETNYHIAHVELAHTSRVASAVIEAMNDDFETLEFKGGT